MSASSNIVSRIGNARACPKCATRIIFTSLRDPSGVNPYFYSEAGKSVLMRQTDVQKFADILDQNAHPEISDQQILDRVDAILREAPIAPDGSRFVLWSNIKCPSCGYEFPYDGGFRSIRRRLTDVTILLDGMHVVRDAIEGDYTIKITLK